MAASGTQRRRTCSRSTSAGVAPLRSSTAPATTAPSAASHGTTGAKEACAPRSTRPTCSRRTTSSFATSIAKATRNGTR